MSFSLSVIALYCVAATVKLYGSIALVFLEKSLTIVFINLIDTN